MLAGVALVPSRGPGAPEAFCRKDEPVTAPLEPLPDNLLGAPGGFGRAPEGVDVGCIEEGHAPGGRPVHDRDRGLLIALEAEGHRTETETRDLQAGPAQALVLHVRAPTVGREIV